jgi:uncharacterized membrane protein (DUF4010 family)
MVLTFALAPMAFAALCRFAVPGLVASLIAALVLMRRAAPDHGADDPALKLRNPFDLAPALLLTALVMVLSLIARWVLEHYGDAGLATVLAITGMVDVDSAIITIGNLPTGALRPEIAALVLAPPILLNTLIKAGMAASLSGGRKGWPGALSLVVSAIASAGGAVTLF